MAMSRGILFVVLAALAAAGRVRTRFPQPGSQAQIPGGPWLRQAQDIQVAGNRVCARLRRDDMSWADDCVTHTVGQEFDNVDGTFQVHTSDEPVGGTWIETARNVRREGNLVFAELRKEDLSYESVALVVRETEYFENRDGKVYRNMMACSSMSHCLHGYTMRPDPFYIYCSTLVCDPTVDRDTCCEPAMPCSNITTCVYPQIPDPNNYCLGVECVEELDKDRCCVGVAKCDSLGQCNYGWVLKPNPETILCPTVVCDHDSDLDLCCDAAARCSTMADQDCPVDRYFNPEEFCAGTSCDVSRDRMICCHEAQSCEYLNCTHGYVPKTNASEAFCDGAQCDLERDLLHCCDAAEPCSNVTCPYGYVSLPDTYCLGAECNVTAGDFEQCCYDAAPCSELNGTACPHGLFFDSDRFCDGVECVEERDRDLCCQVAQSCSHLTCPLGYWAKPGDLYCDGYECDMARDRDICCDVADPCGSLACPLGYVIKLDHVGRYCHGPACEVGRDRDLCCDVAMACSENYTCPYGYWTRGPDAYCDGTLCEVDRDFDLCCTDAAPCTDITCPRNYVQIPNTYCAGTSCDYDRDVFTCCERGMALQWYRFSPLETRSEERVQIAELRLYFFGSQISMDGAAATSPGGNYPGSESPDKAIDGNTGTKWLDEDVDLAAPYLFASLVVQLAQSEPIDSYAWVTPNDIPERDPVAWRFEGSEDGVTWVPLGEVLSGGAAEVPTDRLAETPHFPISVPCFAPENIANSASPSCAEGLVIGHSGTCTPACASGTPSEGSLACSMGELTPGTWTCD